MVLNLNTIDIKNKNKSIATYMLKLILNSTNQFGNFLKAYIKEK
jgi:hypothetical protein